MSASTSEQHDALVTPSTRVRVVPPRRDNGYWRLEWSEHGKRCQTTGGRSLETATKKALQIDERLERRAQPESRERLADALDRYVVHLQVNAAPNTASKSAPDLRKALKPYGALRCEAITDRHLRSASTPPTTASAAAHRRSRIRSFLKWGKQNGYFSADQTHLLDDYDWSPRSGTPARPRRRQPRKVAGEASRYVTPDQIPTLAAIADLGDAFGELIRYGKLLIEHCHASGYRSGELYAASALDIDLEKRQCEINWQALSLSRLSSRLALPKGEKVRVTNFPDVTTTGFHLRDALAERLEQVEQEFEQGKNPHRLLYPSWRGSWWWASSFTQDLFNKAAQSASWASVEWTDEHDRKHRMWVHTMHSLRHRFATDRINVFDHNPDELLVAGGWDSAQTLWERYYGTSAGVLESSGAKLLRGPTKIA
jgi:integrase